MSALANPRALADLALFRGLAPADLAALNGLMHRSTFPANATVLAVAQPGDVAYVVLTGTVKVHLPQPDGGDVILAVLGPGEPFGELSLVDRSGRSASVVTLEPVTLLWLGRAAFEGALETVPGLTRNLLALLARRLRLANAQIEALATLDVRGRVARQLLALGESHGEPEPDGAIRIPLRLTQDELAAMVGATRVRVNQVLGEFRRSGAIAVDAQHRISVRDRAALVAHLGSSGPEG